MEHSIDKWRWRSPHADYGRWTENAALGLGTSDLHHIALDRLEGE